MIEPETTVASPPPPLSPLPQGRAGCGGRTLAALPVVLVLADLATAIHRSGCVHENHVRRDRTVPT